MKSVSAVFVVMLFCAVSFAQSKNKANPEAEAALARAGCGPSGIRFDVTMDASRHPFAQPEPGKALVYVFEYDLSGNESPTTKVGLDGRWMGANASDDTRLMESYLFFAVDPGEHNLCTNWQNNSAIFARLGAAINFTAEADKIYYFRLRISHADGFILEPVNSAEGQFLISSHFPATSRQKVPDTTSDQKPQDLTTGR